MNASLLIVFKLSLLLLNAELRVFAIPTKATTIATIATIVTTSLPV